MVSPLVAMHVPVVYSSLYEGCFMLFLPPYSPDLNPIEESFSSGMFLSIHAVTGANIVLVKAWLRRHWQMACDHAQPEIVLLEACGQVTMEKALGWVRHAGYNL